MDKMLLSLAVSLLILNGTAETVIVENGQSPYKIVLPDSGRKDRTARHLATAAKTLQREIFKSTGVTLPVIPEKQFEPGGKAIFLGSTGKSRGLKIDCSDLPDYSGVIENHHGNIFILGRDIAYGTDYSQQVLGSVKALTVFMEDYLGTRFLMPGAPGTCTPAARKISIPDRLKRKVIVHFRYGAGRPQDLMYDYVNYNFGMGGYYTYGGHSYFQAVPAARYYASHPEYFALVGGQRVRTGNHLCITNPEVRKLIYAEMLKRLDAGAQCVELGQSDGFIQCQCPECSRYGNTRDPGEKLWLFHRSLAEKLLKDRPGKRVLIIAYGPTHKPPHSFQDFPPNTEIQISNSKPENLKAFQQLRGVAGFTVYIYNWGGYSILGYTPKISPSRCAEQIRIFLENRVQGIYRCGFGELCGLEGPVYYLFGKLLANDGRTSRQILNDYYVHAFPDSLPFMRSFFDLLHERLEIYAGMADSGKNPSHLLSFIYPPEVLEILQKKLERAEKSVKNPDELKRLALIRNEFDYLTHIIRIIHLYHCYKMQPDRDSFERTAKAVTARNNFIADMYNAKGKFKPVPGWAHLTNPFWSHPRASVQLNGRDSACLGAPFNWDIPHLRKSGVLPGFGNKKMQVSRTSKKPAELDFSSGPWAKTPWQVLSDIQLGKLQDQTRFKMLYDSERLYLAVETDLPDNRKITPCGRDGAAWRSDCLEFMIDPFGTREKFYHLIWTPAEGSYYDAAFGFIEDVLDPRYKEGDRFWNGCWQIHNRREKGKWYSLISIRFKDLKVATPSPGTVWCMNVGRESTTARKGQMQLSLWSPNFESLTFHSSDAFGEIEFR